MAKKKEWTEGEIALAFNLSKVVDYTPLMQEWLADTYPYFSELDEYKFENLQKAHFGYIENWNEAEIRMKLVAPILNLGKLNSGDNFVSFFSKRIFIDVQGISLSQKADFIVGKGIGKGRFIEKSYFHFQQFKHTKKPLKDSKAQLLTLFLIAQARNNDGKPLYGCEINSSVWTFVTMENSNYCVSKAFDSRDKEDLLTIIAVLRKFRHILETVLLV